MLDEIEKEIKKECEKCKEKKCLKNECCIYRIKQYIKYDEERTTFNIDDFFEKDDKNQISIFDVED